MTGTTGIPTTSTANIIPGSIAATSAQIGSAATRRSAPTFPPSEAAKEITEAGTQRSDGAGGIEPPHAPTTSRSSASTPMICRGPILLLDLRRHEHSGRVDVDTPIGGNVDALVDDVPLLGRPGASVGRLALVGFLVQGLGVGLDDGGNDGGRFVKGRRPVQG